MSRVGKRLSNRQVSAEASEWFVSFRFDAVDASEQKRFSEWLLRSPEHIQAYLEVTGVWSDLPGADPNSRLDVAALIERARAQTGDVIALGETLGPITRATSADSAAPTRARRGFIAAAVAVALAASIAAVTVWRFNADTYSTGVAEHRTITLADRSTITLDARTRIRVRLSRTQRSIELVAGRALFDVTKDELRPFVVTAGERKVVAVGTQFDVDKRQSSTVVTVLEGRVAVMSEGARAVGSSESGSPAAVAPVYLSAWDQAVVTPSAPVSPKHLDRGVVAALTQRKLVFDATPLAEVVEEFNRYNQRVLVVDDAELRSLGISGIYSSTDPTSLVRFLSDVPGIHVRESDREIHIAKISP